MVMLSQQNFCSLVYKMCLSQCCLVYVYNTYFPVLTSVLYILCALYDCACVHMTTSYSRT